MFTIERWSSFLTPICCQRSRSGWVRLRVYGKIQARTVNVRVRCSLHVHSMARAFLVEVARRLGREEVECPFIRRLVLDEWLDSVEDLRALPPSRWEVFRLEYRIPARFVDAVVELLQAPLASTDAASQANSVSASSDAATSSAAVARLGHHAQAAVPLPAVQHSSSESTSVHGAVHPTPAPRKNEASAADLQAPEVNRKTHQWAAIPRFFQTALPSFWGKGKNDMTVALETVLLLEENIRTYGILGKTLDQASLSGVASFAKAAWLGGKGGSLEPGSVRKELFDALHMIHAVDAPRPQHSEGYGAALILGDCGLEELRVRFTFARHLVESGACGEGTAIHVVASAKVGGTLGSAEAAEAQVRQAIGEMVSEVFGGADGIARNLHTLVVRVTSFGDATPLLRAWFRDAPKAEPGSPLLIVSSQPYALAHELKADKVVREKREWFEQWPPWLMHVCAPEASASTSMATALDALGRTLGEMELRERRLRKAEAKKSRL